MVTTSKKKKVPKIDENLKIMILKMNVKENDNIHSGKNWLVVLKEFYLLYFFIIISF